MKTNRPALTSEQIAELSPSLFGDRATLPNGVVYRWSDVQDMWIHWADGPTAADVRAAREEDALRDAAKVLGFQDFACMALAMVTKRAPIAGYTVAGKPGAWTLAHGGAPMISGRDASTVYGWFERTPLRQAALDADDMRARFLGHV